MVFRSGTSFLLKVICALNLNIVLLSSPSDFTKRKIFLHILDVVQAVSLSVTDSFRR